MVCSGNTLQICGGPYGLRLYQTTNNIAVKNSYFISSSNSPSILPSNSTSSTLITPSYLRQVLPLRPPFPPPAPTWTYTGCITDSSTRVLTSSSTTSPNMTISICRSFCLASDYPLAGLEYASQCFCGNSLASNTSSTACTMACASNASQIRGGGFALSLCAYTGFIAPSQTAPKIGNYSYQGY
jgi:hypothetical protein